MIIHVFTSTFGCLASYQSSICLQNRRNAVTNNLNFQNFPGRISLDPSASSWAYSARYFACITKAHLNAVATHYASLRFAPHSPRGVALWPAII